MKGSKEIYQIVKNLKPYRPQKIILFGSYAWGKPTKNSDIDILIIKNTKRDHYKRIPELRSYLRNIDQPFDILVLTPKEINKRLRLGDFFIENIIKKARFYMSQKKKIIRNWPRSGLKLVKMNSVLLKLVLRN